MAEAINPWVHILAATIWVGPQVFLFVAAIPAVRTIEDAQLRARVVRVLSTRFAYLAWGAMAVLVLTGIGNLLGDDESVSELFDMNFGAIFMAKMVLVVSTVVLTTAHTFVIGPRLLDLQESAADEAALAPTRRASVILSAVNLLLALGIVFCAALLGTDFAHE